MSNCLPSPHMPSVTVRSLKSIQERVEQARGWSVDVVVDIIYLENGNILRINDGPCDIDVEICFEWVGEVSICKDATLSDLLIPGAHALVFLAGSSQIICGTNWAIHKHSRMRELREKDLGKMGRT